MSDQKPKSIRSSRKATKVDADSEDSARSRSMSGGRSRSLPDEMKASAKSSGRNQSKYKRISKIVSSSEGEDFVDDSVSNRVKNRRLKAQKQKLAELGQDSQPASVVSAPPSGPLQSDSVPSGQVGSCDPGPSHKNTRTYAATVHGLDLSEAKTADEAGLLTSQAQNAQNQSIHINTSNQIHTHSVSALGAGQPAAESASGATGAGGE